ncbi:hypothetical protein [Methanobacterium paludis]|uniref:Glycosyltransferase RgtA/B/C/D-like domain-containing protein n=1 Tax=Methanobacterium paludis (strain DSM 25820 / JCM 18151 / SWAN1) TaxID=868131 RepID=F6D898_METPW|nr:hypothetical protein [Methanobacterium paludis]AEG18532.1 hypothetical protein MSWAN_1518 [Methanobacterium paludis]
MKTIDKVKMVTPFAPLILIFLLMILRPYYLFPVGGDTDFHLARAMEILQNPLQGLFWDNITYYPMGRPIWHQPLFHVVYAFVWYLGGVRFAQSFMCIIQVLLTVGVASWIANKRYGVFAGFFAGFFALFIPAPSTLIAAIPATYVPILAVLTIYYIPQDKKKAFAMSLLALWTHMTALASFIPLFIVDNYKDKKNLKIIALLLPSWLFWVGYWIYFSNRLVTGGIFYSFVNPKFISVNPASYSFLIFLSILLLGTIGLYLLYKLDNKQFKLYLTYILTVVGFSLFGFNGDFLRSLEFIALPLAILSGLTVQMGYNHISKTHRPLLSSVFLLMFLGLSLLGVTIFSAELPNQHGMGWNALNYPFEWDYAPVKYYIEDNTNKNDVLWAQNDLAEKIAWMTGRKVSNGMYPDGIYGATRGFADQHQKINVYQSDRYVLINDFNNRTIAQIKVSN